VYLIIQHLQELYLWLSFLPHHITRPLLLQPYN